VDGVRGAPWNEAQKNFLDNKGGRMFFSPPLERKKKGKGRTRMAPKLNLTFWFGFYYFGPQVCLALGRR
jgi:hypothetical protein